MTSIGKVRSDERASWDKALALYRGQLQFYLDYLLQCECTDQILAIVEAEVRERSVPDEFKLRFLSRAVIRNVIRHFRECIHAKDGSHLPAPDDASHSRPAIPTQERLVYFMQDILDYSTRDTALLIGITDAQVGKLLSFARKRIAMTEEPSSSEVEMPEWTCFRWKFVDLHLG